MNRIAAVSAALALIGSIATGAWAIDERYALNGEFQQLAERLDKKILEDREHRLQRRLWQLQDRYGSDCGPEKQTCRDIRQELAKIRRRLG